MSNDEVLAGVTRSVGELTAFISSMSAKNLTAGDRTALRGVLDELEALVHAASGLDGQATNLPPQHK